MEAMAQIGVLAAATLLAAGTAFGMAWAFLQGAFRLMQPAGATNQTQVRTANLGQASARARLELARGTRAAARAFGKN
jgi:hypothetical protein